jgi:SPP1 gp7 family putative phage head morphogenesis protein
LKNVDRKLGSSINATFGVNVALAFTNDGPIRKKLAAATQANVGLIRSIPEQYFDEIEKTVRENYKRGRRFNAIIDQIAHVGKVHRSRAKLIARDQTSKLNSAFNAARQTSIGITEYVWQTAGDDRVRETHADNDGKVFAWDDPPEETGNPGDDVNCRCLGLPYFDLDAMEAA